MTDNFTEEYLITNNTSEFLSNGPRNLVTSWLAYKIGKSNVGYASGGSFMKLLLHQIQHFEFI